MEWQIIESKTDNHYYFCGMDFPEGKRYNSYVGHFRRLYGERLQKLVLDAGFTCPNRDGTVGIGGCTYCDNAAFHPGYSTPGKSLLQQIDEGISFHQVRYRSAGHYLAYFQAYSGTYAPLDTLRARYYEALSHPDVVGIVIGTRPDCIGNGVLDLLEELRRTPLEMFKGHKEISSPQEENISRKTAEEADGPREEEHQIRLEEKTKGPREEVEMNGGRSRFEYPIIIVEYGIESCLDRTLQHINRGHDFACARKAVEQTADRGIPVGAHFILGLSGESEADMLEQCSLINSLPLTSIKFHQLQIIRGTAMESEFASYPERFVQWKLEEYIDFIIDILERLRPDLSIERVAGEVPPRFVSETRWGLIRNFEILHLLDKRLEERDTWQGRLYCLK